MSFLLRYDNEYRQTFYLTRLGDWYNSQRLIAETSPSPERALRFDTAPEAAAVIASAGGPAGWTIVEVA